MTKKKKKMKKTKTPEPTTSSDKDYALWCKSICALPASVRFHQRSIFEAGWDLGYYAGNSEK